MNGLRAILVCVDYHDLLSLTLPYNRHHFSDVMVVTSEKDSDNKTIELAHSLNCKTFRTKSFWDRGALFNKWLALEKGLDEYGRDGWLAILDADVLWPKSLSVLQTGDGLDFQYMPPGQFVSDIRDIRFQMLRLHPGQLCTPTRRMLSTIPSILPPESEWGRYPLHQNLGEFAGYTQIFHASDPVLGTGHWHETNWRHAGGADSFFQEKWDRRNKIRPPFSVLHLGPAGTNWCGRVSRYADGSEPEGAGERVEQLRGFIRGRKGKSFRNKYAHEKLD